MVVLPGQGRSSAKFFATMLNESDLSPIVLPATVSDVVTTAFYGEKENTPFDYLEEEQNHWTDFWVSLRTDTIESNPTESSRIKSNQAESSQAEPTHATSCWTTTRVAGNVRHAPRDGEPRREKLGKRQQKPTALKWHCGIVFFLPFV